MKEIIVNFWYVCDEQWIYHVRAKPYVCDGTEAEKLAFLQSRASLDYLIALPFDVPEVCYPVIDETSQDQQNIQWSAELKTGENRPLEVGVMRLAYELPEYRNLLLEQAFKKLGDSIPEQTQQTIPDEPLMCITPVMTNDDGEIIGVQIDGVLKLV